MARMFTKLESGKVKKAKALTPDEKIELLVTAAHRVLSTAEGPRPEANNARADLRDVLKLVDPTGVYVNPNQSRTVAVPASLALVSSRPSSKSSEVTPGSGI